ncbi:MAG: methionyl-tRNA formyltransferase, partial [Bacteroidales bacterium]
MSTTKPRIIFMGTPEFAVASLDALIQAQMNVVAVVTVPDKIAGRGQKLNESAVKQYAIAHQLPL